MYQSNEMDPWRQHREDLLLEAERERLVRQLGAARPKGAARLRNALLGRGPVPGEAAVNLSAGNSGCA
jgi:hypothetical protein